MSTGLYTHIFRPNGTLLTAGVYNTDHQAHVDGNVPLLTGAYSDTVSQMQIVTDPGAVGAESFAVDYSGELERLRFVVQEVAQYVQGSATPQWYSIPTGRNIPQFRGARVFSGIDITLTSNVNTALTFTASLYNSGVFSLGDPTKLTAPVDGLYHMGAALRVLIASATQIQATIVKNGTTVLGAVELSANEQDGSGHVDVSLNTEYFLTAGDFVELFVNTTDVVFAGNQVVKAQPQYSPHFWLEGVGPSTPPPLITITMFTDDDWTGNVRATGSFAGSPQVFPLAGGGPGNPILIGTLMVSDLTDLFVESLDAGLAPLDNVGESWSTPYSIFTFVNTGAGNNYAMHTTVNMAEASPGNLHFTPFP